MATIIDLENKSLISLSRGESLGVILEIRKRRREQKHRRSPSTRTPKRIQTPQELIALMSDEQKLQFMEMLQKGS